LGSLLALVLGLLTYRRLSQQRWLAVAAIVVGGAGLMLALTQLMAALSAVLGASLR